MTALSNKTCLACTGDTEPLDATTIASYLDALDDRWQIRDEKELTATFKFKRYEQTRALVSDVADIADDQDHHPTITFGYNECVVIYTTHAIGALSENDFICAAKIDLLTR